VVYGGLKDIYFMKLALIEAYQAFSEGEVPVGAVLVSGGHVLCHAHNRCEKDNDPTAHAEVNVIRQSAFLRRSWRLEDTTLYVTKEPCIMCAGAMVNARIFRVVFGCHDIKGGAVESLYQLANDSRLNHRLAVTSGVRGDECAHVLKKFFSLLRKK
jgi:tRNA(adenine34) deaminase